MKFGAWNGRGCRNKMEEIIREINIMKMDVVVLTETKKKGTRSETLGNLYTPF
jgi:hypothetical protein